VNLERIALIPPVDVPRRPVAPPEIRFHTPMCSQVMTKLDRDVRPAVRLTRYIGLIASIDSFNMCLLMILFVTKHCHELHTCFQKKSVRWMFSINITSQNDR